MKTTLIDQVVPAGPTGLALLREPSYNKGTAFTLEERERLGLEGLLPPHVSTMAEQIARVLENVRGQSSDLARYVEMIGLLDRNETLFYRVVLDHLDELMPIIYTPVVGAACKVYGHIFRRPRGLFLTRRERGRFREILSRWPRRDVRVIVATDGARILGLGDLGANGMGIPVGKLALYTACAGVPPEQTLPVMLDVGTNDEALLRDPLYLGMHERRIEGPAYDELLDEFVCAAREAFPRALIQFEDFATQNAFGLLERYRERACVFNDDIQGTAAVALAGLVAAERVTGRRLEDERLLFCGAGEAAIGIASLYVAALAERGVPASVARAKCWLFDSKGLVVAGRGALDARKSMFAHPHAQTRDLAEAVERLRPTALIGVSGKAGVFDEKVVARMAAANERPVVFALSNPTANSECTAEQAYGWTGGRALFASGSPFPRATFGGRTFVPGQGNNAYIFPGVGLGVSVSGARRVTEKMFLEAARVLASCVTQEDLTLGRLYPGLSRIREVSALIAAAVARAATEQGLAAEPVDGDALARVQAAQYQPVYR